MRKRLKKKLLRREPVKGEDFEGQIFCRDYKPRYLLSPCYPWRCDCGNLFFPLTPTTISVTCNICNVSLIIPPRQEADDLFPVVFS